MGLCGEAGGSGHAGTTSSPDSVDSRIVRAQASTLRLKLIKIGAVVVRNTRRVRFLLSSAYPLQNLFAQAVAKLSG